MEKRCRIDAQRSRKPEKEQNRESNEATGLPWDSLGLRANSQGQKHVLICGDGDFAYSGALVEKLDRMLCSFGRTSQFRVCCTAYSSSPDRYALQNCEQIANRTLPDTTDITEVDIKHGVDARKLGEHLEKERKFDRVVFNFPHGEHRRKVQSSQELVREFFRSARETLTDSKFDQMENVSASASQYLHGDVTESVQADAEGDIPVGQVGLREDACDTPMDAAFRSDSALSTLPLDTVLEHVPSIWIALCTGQGGTEAETDRCHEKMFGALKNSWNIVDQAAAARLRLLRVGPPANMPYCPGGFRLFDPSGSRIQGSSPDSSPTDESTLESSANHVKPTACTKNDVIQNASTGRSIPQKFWQDCRIHIFVRDTDYWQLFLKSSARQRNTDVPMSFFTKRDSSGTLGIDDNATCVLQNAKQKVALDQVLVDVENGVSALRYPHSVSFWLRPEESFAEAAERFCEIAREFAESRRLLIQDAHVIDEYTPGIRTSARELKDAKQSAMEDCRAQTWSFFLIAGETVFSRAEAAKLVTALKQIVLESGHL
eukprot:TRINITY_DN40115_c0_g1_i1.p1 TRINITY_DN40115_c0_g1~~TRINITY_DN40115_c0_g1_i1.p1  ORF type:complete len:545 (+),score=42.07 TRINITY_DN40115_c0_g1_i1:146-1780(+)